ncbi:MAG: secretin N-terminal domain-containing protein, partial [bacterium]
MKLNLKIISALILIIMVLGQTSRRFTALDFQAASLQAVFQFLAETGNINIIVDPSVKGTVTMRLKDVSWQDVLDIILETYGLIGLKEKNYIRVMYKADYFKSEVAEKQYEEQKRELEELETKIIRINYATASEIASTVQGILSGRGTVTVDQRTNSIIVRDIPKIFKKVEDLVAELDKPTKQLRISAKIMLIDSNYLNELGIRWQAEKTTTQPGGTVSAAAEADLVATKLASFTWGVI